LDIIFAHISISAIYNLNSTSKFDISSHNGSSNKYNNQTDFISDASFSSIIPIGLRLIQRFKSDEQIMGLILIREIVENTSSTLLQAATSWILPCLFTTWRATTDVKTKTVVCRIIHSILAVSTISTISKKYSHMMLETFCNDIIFVKKPDDLTYIVQQMIPFFENCTIGIIYIQLSKIVTTLLSLLNHWNIKLQANVLKILYNLIKAAPTGMKFYKPKIIIELKRLNIFYSYSLKKDNDIVINLAKSTKIQVEKLLI
jgi:hypothetical protein